MSIAVEELRNQLTETKKDGEKPKPPKIKMEKLNDAKHRGMSLLSTFPWFDGILEKCREAIGTKDANTLNGLLYAFVKKLSVSIKDCYSRPNRAGKLRDLVCLMLVYFNMVDRGLREECMDNNNTYLHLMTELLAMYLDLEIKASKRSVHSLKKIGQFMTTALYTHLGRSEDHIIEAILKAKLITKSSGELCAPVLSKVLKDGRCFIGDENAYVRFLLAFKLLQKITRKTDIRNVTKMAMRKLDPAPGLVRNVRRMNNIFPQQIIMDKPITAFLMNVKFDFIKAKLEFLRTGSISKGCQCDICGNRSSSVTNSLKQCATDVQNDKDIDPANNNDLDPSTYKFSLHGKDKGAKDECGEDDDAEVEFLGTRSMADKPVVLITLDSDEESEENPVDEKSILNRSSEDRVDSLKKSNNAHAIIGGILDMKLESCEEMTPKKCVPESNGGPDSAEKENSSTKHAGVLLPSTLQSPEHGVIESTNNFIDSVLDKSFRSPVRKTDDAHSNADEGRTEVSSSLDFVDSTVDLFNEDYFKTREPEISSTRDKSESFSSAGDDLSNLTNDLYTALNFDANTKSWDIGCADSAHRFSPSDFSSKGSNGVDGGVIASHEKDGAEMEYCSSTSRSNMHNGRSERTGITDNYSQANQRNEELSDVDSIFACERVKPVSCHPGMIQKTGGSNAAMGVANEPGRIRQRPGSGMELDHQSLGTQLAGNEPRHVRKEEKVSQKAAEIVKNVSTVSSNLDNLMGKSAKKVNYENVLKSYKIVKSKCLKTTEVSESPAGQSTDASERTAVRATKFIKMDKSGVIGNINVREGMSFMSKSLDFRTLSASSKGRDEGEVSKAIEQKNVGSRKRTSQCVPIIFKKIDEKSQAAERKRKASQRGNGSNNDTKSSKSNQAGKRKQKSNASNVIKTDINMKSTLKHINPSSIPQFATEFAKDCGVKYPEMEPGPAKVKGVSDAQADTQENRTLEIKLVIPDKYLGLKSSEALVSHGNDIPPTPVPRPCAAQYPPDYDHNSYAPIPQADSTQEGSSNQFPVAYSTEHSFYYKKPDYPHEIQNSTVEPSHRFFVGQSFDPPPTKFEPQKSNATNLFETVYHDIFPVLDFDGVKYPEAESAKSDFCNEDITGLVERQEGLAIIEDRRYENHGPTSSMEVGMEFSSVWGSGEVTSSTPRDLIISEISVEELRDMDEELRDFVEPWEGPSDCCPDDDEFFLSALPDPQKLFSIEDFSEFDGTFPSANLNFESLRPEDFGNMNAFDDKYLCDIRGGRDLDVLESTFNENFFVLQENFPDCDVPHTDEAHPELYDPCKKSSKISPESRIDDQPKSRFKKGRRSSCSGRKKAGCSVTKKPNRRESMRNKMSVLGVGNTGKADKKTLTSDSVAYHTRSISQKGIPIEYTLTPPKSAHNKKSKLA